MYICALNDVYNILHNMGPNCLKEFMIYLQKGNIKPQSSRIRTIHTFTKATSVE